MRNARSILAALGLAALALPFAARAAGTGGTITGKVDVLPSRYLGETVVYLKEVPGSHGPAKTITVDQQGMQFVPHVVTVVAGDTVNFANHDHVFHNVYSPGPTGYFLGTFPAGQSVTKVFDKQGVFSQLCSIHPEMLAFVFVGQNPYAAVVDKAGHYSIPNVPAGHYELAIWNSHFSAPDEAVTVEAGKPLHIDWSLHR